MSHTSGPWYVEGVGGIQMDGFRDGYYITSADVRKVASTYPYGSKDRKQRWADATLIAAAPDLLAACERLAAFDCCDGYELNLDDYRALWDVLNEARDAVAKAKGEEQ